jgi:succinate dehydrogenase flavin-adding protein (antitoxin of CptAB toxin-antitoxin module)
MNKLINFIKCLWKFAPTFWNYPYWDYTFMLKNMKNSTELMLDSYIENKIDNEDTKNLKRIIQLLDYAINDVYYLSNSSNFANSEAYAKNIKEMIKKEERDWEELFERLKGNSKGLEGIKSWWV